MATVTVEYHGVAGSGENLTKAREDALRKLGRCNKDPLIIAHRGVTLVAWQGPDGVSYSYTDPDTVGSNVGSSWEPGTLADCRADLARRLLTRCRVEGEYEVPSWAAGMMPPYARDRMVSDWKRDDEFQVRYREAKARGMDDRDAHDYAGRNPGRRDLWESEALAAV